MANLTARLRKLALLFQYAAPEAEFYMTYNREKPKGLSEVLPRIEDPDRNLMQREFKRTFRDLFKEHGLEVIPKDTVGYWQGKIEPSTMGKVEVGPEDEPLLKSLASKMGYRYNQDSVLVFVNDGGDDVKYVFPSISLGDRKLVSNILRKNGVLGATYLKENGGRLVLFGIRRFGDLPKIQGAIRAMIKKGLDVMPTTYTGSVLLVDRNEYQEHM